MLRAICLRSFWIVFPLGALVLMCPAESTAKPDPGTSGEHNKGKANQAKGKGTSMAQTKGNGFHKGLNGGQTTPFQNGFGQLPGMNNANGLQQLQGMVNPSTMQQLQGIVKSFPQPIIIVINNPQPQGTGLQNTPGGKQPSAATGRGAGNQVGGQAGTGGQ